MHPITAKIIAALCLLSPPSTLLLGETAPLSKNELDLAAKEAGFSESDYPYYSSPNGCGPDGWKSQLVPDKSHFLEGANWSDACNQHDRDYMSLGMDRKMADNRLRDGMHNAMKDFLEQTVEQTFKRAIKRTVTKMVPVVRTRKVTQRVKKHIGNILQPWKWVDEVRDVTETVYEEVKEEVDDTIDDVKTVKRASLLSPEQLQKMEEEIEMFYAAVQAQGGPHYDGSQEKQQKYTTWATKYINEHPSDASPTPVIESSG